jgi:hypothetical protein
MIYNIIQKSINSQYILRVKRPGTAPAVAIEQSKKSQKTAGISWVLPMLLPACSG